MSVFYFNHSVLEYQKDEASLISKLIELGDLNRRLIKEKHQIYVYSDVWDTPIFGTTLGTFLYRLSNKEAAKFIILTLINAGPFYYKILDDNKSFKIIPKLNSERHAYRLLTICYNDKRNLILSISGEEDLSENEYTVSLNEDEYKVENFTSYDGLNDYFSRLDIPVNINEVFNIIEEKYNNIIILDNAKKSAKNHNFHGRYIEILKAIIALEEIELKLLNESTPDEVRENIYQKETGLIISKESDATLRLRKYRREREFIIPNTGEKKLFEWHVKIGNNIRIHYYIDKENLKVYLGHCGKHLGTNSYNS